MANGRNNAVDEVLNGAGPAPTPGDGAGLAFSLVGAQLVDADALGQPQGTGQRDVLVQTLLE